MSDEAVSVSSQGLLWSRGDWPSFVRCLCNLVMRIEQAGFSLRVKAAELDAVSAELEELRRARDELLRELETVRASVLFSQSGPRDAALHELESATSRREEACSQVKACLSAALWTEGYDRL